MKVPMQNSILNFFSPDKAKTKKDDDDPDFVLPGKQSPKMKPRKPVTICDDVEDIVGLLFSQNNEDSNESVLEKDIVEDTTDSSKITQNTGHQSQSPSYHSISEQSPQVGKYEDDCDDNHEGRDSPVLNISWRNKAPKVYQKQVIDRPDSPEIVIPELEPPVSPHGRSERRFSFNIGSPRSKQFFSHLKSPVRSTSPNSLMFDEARLIKSSNAWELDSDDEITVHPKKRLKTSSDDHNDSLTETSSIQISPLAKLVAKKLVIPCLQPPSAFANPPKEIEFYNLRQSISNSRQKNYVVMSMTGVLSNTKLKKKDATVYYEIESIVTHKMKSVQADKQFLFLVKWRGFSDKYNSWEPEAHFALSPVMLLDYITKVHQGISSKSGISDEMKAIKVKMRKLQSRINHKNSHVYVWQLDAELSVNAFKQQYRKLLRQYSNKVSEELGASFPTVEIQNTVDYNLPPLNFTFVRDRFAGKGVHISDDTLIGCVCSGEYGVANCCLKDDVQCCPHLGGAGLPYNNKGRLVLKPGSPIYECNARCSCGPDCGNRIVQRGTLVKTAIYKTPEKGWGLKTLEHIPKGTFVVEYVGEVVTFQEAEQRGREYDAQGLTYLFDLDYQTSDDKDDEMFTIDAAFYGNTSHFINHSCDPNLAVFSCWIANLDIRLPHICLFAIKSINAGEELTFNYQIDRIVEEGNRAAQRLCVECRCGSKNCVRYLHG